MNVAKLVWEEGDEVKSGVCRSCGRPLVQVVGRRTYHPAETFPPGSKCMALLPIKGARLGVMSFDVDEEDFEEMTDA